MAAEKKSIQELQKITQNAFEEAMNNPNVPKIYANGFHLGFNDTDNILLLNHNGKPSIVLSLPYTVAKTLLQQLGKNISDVEKQLGHEFPTMEEMDRARRSIPETSTITPVR